MRWPAFTATLAPPLTLNPARHDLKSKSSLSDVDASNRREQKTLNQKSWGAANNFNVLISTKHVLTLLAKWLLLINVCCVQEHTGGLRTVFEPQTTGVGAQILCETTTQILWDELVFFFLFKNPVGPHKPMCVVYCWCRRGCMSNGNSCCE